MKKLIYTLFFVLISVVANGQAKYVFYFIGDGMGVNQVNGTEMYQAEIQNGRIGVEPLLFTQFPVATVATTFSAKNSVVDRHFFLLLFQKFFLLLPHQGLPSPQF